MKAADKVQRFIGLTNLVPVSTRPHGGPKRKSLLTLSVELSCILIQNQPQDFLEQWSGYPRMPLLFSQRHSDKKAGTGRASLNYDACYDIMNEEKKKKSRTGHRDASKTKLWLEKTSLRKLHAPADGKHPSSSCSRPCAELKKQHAKQKKQTKRVDARLNPRDPMGTFLNCKILDGNRL